MRFKNSFVVADAVAVSAVVFSAALQPADTATGTSALAATGTLTVHGRYFSAT